MCFFSLYSGCGPSFVKLDQFAGSAYHLQNRGVAAPPAKRRRFLESNQEPSRMKAEHRKELETNILADKMGKFITGAKTGPSRGSVRYLVIAAVVVLAI